MHADADVGLLGPGRHPRAIDLTTGPLGRPAGRWTNPVDYTVTQALGVAARIAGLAAIRAPSARQAGGINLAVLDPAALVPPPRPHSSWAFLATDGPAGEGLIAMREMSDQALRFTHAGFDDIRHADTSICRYVDVSAYRQSGKRGGPATRAYP